MSRDVLQYLSLAKIRPSPLNPRKHFDEARLRELAESVAAQGVLQPILVRPWPEGQPDPDAGGEAPAPAWEVAAGERRYRAACLAGLRMIPAFVRELTDRELLELAVTENEQREDVTPLEKAEGYGRLVDEHGLTLEEVAAKVGKAVSTVRGLLRLRQLPEAARKALEAGELSASVAELIGSRPSPALREKVAEYALEPYERWERGEVVKLLPSYRQVKDWIARECQVELKQASFSRKALDLVEGAGSCEDCPKRAGNNREEFPDTRADVCFDPECFRAKEQAHRDRLAAAARAEGKTVLEAAEARKLFDKYSPGRLAAGSGYVDLDAPCHELPYGHKRRGATYRKLVGKHVADQVVLAYDEKGTLHHLAPAKAAAKALKEHHGVKDRSEQDSASDRRYRQQQARERARQRLAAEVGRRCQALAVAAAEEAFGALAGFDHRLTGLLRLLVAGHAGECWSVVQTAVLRSRGETSGRHPRRQEGLGGLVESLDARGLFGLWAELVAARRVQDAAAGYAGERLRKDRNAFFKALGVDWSAVEKQVQAEQAAKQNGKARPHKNGRAARDLTPGEILDVVARQDAAEEQASAPAGEAWRNVPLAELKLPKGAERLLRSKGYLSAGEAFDYASGARPFATPPGPVARQILAAVEAARAELAWEGAPC